MAQWTRRGMILVILGWSLSLSALPADAEHGPVGACMGDVEAMAVWPGIVFTHAADVAEYRQVMDRNRLEVRRQLEGELVWMLQEVGRYGADPEDMIEPVLSALMAFDDAYDRHRVEAVQSMPLYLEVSVRSRLDRLYREHRIPNDQRKVYFANLGLVERLKGLRQRLDAQRSVREEQLEAMLQIVEAVDAVAYGTFSSDGRTHHLTLTLENVSSGGICEFAVSGPLEEVTALLAEAVFDEFQAVDYPVVRNPNPHLEWYPPPPGRERASVEEALLYCRSQAEDGRLPYTLELLQASQVGSEGASYVQGGIPRLQPGLWAVGDRLHADEPHFYHQLPPGRTEDHPAGPVRTGAGLGEVTARYWCVSGEPSDRVVRIQELYRLHRTMGKAYPDSPALAAIDYLLNREWSLGPRIRRDRSFPSEEAAWAAVSSACEDRTGEGGETESELLLSRTQVRDPCDLPGFSEPAVDGSAPATSGPRG